MFKPFELVLLALLVTVILMLATTLQQNGVKGVDSSSLLDSQFETRSQPIINIMNKGGDDRYTMAPRPQRVWDNGPEIPARGFLDPIPTRGPPENYQQMGVITGEDGQVLPLYGRRTAPRSDRFQYYTRTDTYNPVALPVLHKKRDCQDGVGCEELFSGDEVKMAATGKNAKVTLYGFDGPLR